MIGRVGVCSKGRVGYITGQKELQWGLSFVGVGLDGHPWASRDPYIVSDDVALDLLSNAVSRGSIFIFGAGGALS